MSDENMTTSSGQMSDLGSSNDVQQNTNGTFQASGNAQSSNDNWADRERAILAKAYQQAQSLVDKSANRQSNQFQGMIDQFRSEFGVTLTPEQAQQMAQNQMQRSQENAPAQAQAQEQDPYATDAQYNGFMYYHGVRNDSPLFREVFEVQKTLGVELDKTDEEYQKLIHPEHKYKPREFVNAWKQACINKMVRLQNANQNGNAQNDANLGRMPIIGGQGRRANNFDPNRSGKSYLSAYLKDKVK